MSSAPLLGTQADLDFTSPRQKRITQALRSTGAAVRRAVPLSENDRLMLLCMQQLAQQIADEVAALPEVEAMKLTSQRVTAIVGALDDVSESFALETARYLTETTCRLRQAAGADRTSDPAQSPVSQT